jgi:hypothetical protein
LGRRCTRLYPHPMAKQDAPPPYLRFAAEVAVTLMGLALVGWAFCADRVWWETHALPNGCATSAWELALARAARLAALVGSGVLVLLVRPRLGRWLATDPRGAALLLARVVGAAVLALTLSEMVLSWRSKPPLFPSDVPAIQPDAHLSRALVPSCTTEVVRGGRSISFAINALGLRARTQDDMPDLARPTILVAGESIAQGYAVPYEESVPALVERTTHIQTLNAGVATYANDQVYRRTEQVLGLLERPLAVVTFVVPLQIQRNVDRRRERLALGPDGSLVVTPPAAPSLLRDTQLYQLFDRVLPHDHSAFDLTRAILRATAKGARARGAFPLFVNTNWLGPCFHDETGESSLAHRHFEGLDLPYVSVDLDPAWEVPQDLHPDVRGSRALATAIVEALRKAAILPDKQ